MPQRVLRRWLPRADQLHAVFALLGALVLVFAWGVATVKWKVFPHRFLVNVEAGLDALGKFESEAYPPHFIALAEGVTAPDPVEALGPVPDDLLVVMTGGFEYRRDLCPDHGCLAMVMERDGTVLHTWEYDRAELFPAEVLEEAFRGTTEPQSVYVQGVDLGPAGDLVVTFQARNMFPYQVAVAAFSWEGALKWLRVDQSHHWPHVGPSGAVITPIARIEQGGEQVAATRQEMECRFGAVFQEGVQVLSPDGEELRRFWLDEEVRQSDMQALAYAVRDDCDPYHVNGTDVVNAAMSARLDGVEEGDLLVSLRSSSSLVVMDREDGTIEHVIYGPMVAQHSPKVLPDGDILVFDNMGGLDTELGTRIIRIAPDTMTHETVFPVDQDAPGADFDSFEEGNVAASPDGRHMLVAGTLNGRLFEVDIETGRVVWLYTSMSDIAPVMAEAGGDVDGPVFARLQTQGAVYLPREAFRRLQGGE